MKVSLIALLSCCAVATSAFASVGGMDEPRPPYAVTDLDGAHPPRLTDLDGAHPPRRNDLDGAHPPRLNIQSVARPQRLAR